MPRASRARSGDGAQARKIAGGHGERGEEKEQWGGEEKEEEDHHEDEEEDQDFSPHYNLSYLLGDEGEKARPHAWEGRLGTCGSGELELLWKTSLPRRTQGKEDCGHQAQGQRGGCIHSFNLKVQGNTNPKTPKGEGCSF